MGFKKNFKRYELKYLITFDQKEKLLNMMKKYMQEDKFGKSTICNIYFDTDDYLLIRRSLEKPCYKEKLRVRSYGIAKNDTPVFIEIKKKFKGVVYKRRIDMEKSKARSYLLEGMKLEKNSQISNEIDYFIDFYKGIKPSTFISYDREAFFSKTDGDFRMTFDQNILARDYDLSLDAGIYGESILKKGMALLEVKTALGIPRWLLDFFCENKIYKSSFSKYGNTYKQMILPKIIGGTEYVS
ncbi:polyphosphate polymerase domain-containing protein [Clostridium sp. BJN0001]|uniref:polyphosphate polymerase domain-containing protein n=1 Tax=Clostridium sp. BJN0001 TaxID=2930219 RepID=UPI001FD5A026|nr:polyphosphate polymerase domain-containing protein [Clostridium sp. BJN0001]